MYHNYSYLIWNFNVSSHWIWIYKQHVESSICDQAMPFAVKPKTIMPNSNSLQASEGQWYLWSFVFQSIGFVLTKYHCPSPACKLLLLGIIVFGFMVKGIARSQIDDSTCLHCLHFKMLLYCKSTCAMIFEVFWSKSWPYQASNIMRLLGILFSLLSTTYIAIDIKILFSHPVFNTVYSV